MKTFLSIYLITGTLVLSAQNIENIGKGSVLKGSGGLSFNQIYNHASGKVPSRNPHTYLFTGNVNLQILGIINAPFNFMYSNMGSRYTQPTFNQTSIHPSYKWISTHFGTISCSYSPYTVNGHLFKGLAIDLTPGKFTFSTFYGCLQKAVNPDNAASASNIVPVYKRMGGGVKIGVRDAKSGSIGLVLFTAKDQLNSLPVLVMPELESPKQNWNGGLQIQKSFFKHLSIMADLSYSLLTEDIRVDERNMALPKGFAFKNANSSTGIYKAFKTGAIYNIKKSTLNFGYERIDPFYRTLGAYYFNNDLENITVGFASQFLKQKISLSANSGIQRDNLLKTKLSTMSRVVGNVNMQIRPSGKFNLNFNYSNFLSYTNVRSFTDYQNQLNPYLQWDTLNFRQISQSITGSAMMILQSDSLVSSSIMATLTYQNAADRQDGVIRNGNSFYNASMGYSFSKKISGETIFVSLNAGKTNLNEMQLLNICPVVNLSKPFFNNKLRPAISLSYTNSYFDNKYSGGVFNVRGSANYILQKVHNFSVAFLLLNRKDNPATSLYSGNQRFSETTVSFNYSVNMDFFDLKRKNVKK